MASKKHLEILKRGVKVWNKWRKATPEIEPNLSRAKLPGASLEKIDLSNSNLSNIDLSHALLRSANLSGAILINAKLTNANLALSNVVGAYLSGAKMRDTNIANADFTGTKLDNADLVRANFHSTKLIHAILYDAYLARTTFNNTDLTGAVFTNAWLDHTVFADCDLRYIEGLTETEHLGPSHIDIQTIYRSNGDIPDAFLRGIGVPDVLITYVHSLIMQPIQFYSCFISYSGKDRLFVERLHADLQNEGVRCWFAPLDLKIGEEIRVGIDESIRIHDKLLLVLSKHSIESEWVKKEVETAFEQEQKQKRKILFPIRLDNTVLDIETGWPADIKRTRHIGDFRKWKNDDTYQGVFQRLLRDLKAVDASGGRA